MPFNITLTQHRRRKNKENIRLFKNSVLYLFCDFIIQDPGFGFTIRGTEAGKALLRKARLLATSKRLVFLPPCFPHAGEARAECSTGSQQPHRTQIIIVIISLYTIKSMPVLAIKTDCVRMTVDSLQVIFD